LRVRFDNGKSRLVPPNRLRFLPELVSAKPADEDPLADWERELLEEADQTGETEDK
jgi:hypothetical protein